MARRRAVGAAFPLIAVAGCLFWASEARAATRSPRADTGSTVQIDVRAFQHFIAARYQLDVRKVVAADLDRDGDLDVVAATDRGFIVWLNDGAGHLTRQPPVRRSAFDGSAAGSAWRGRASPLDEPLQNDLPSLPPPGIYAHAPPAFAPAFRGYDGAARRLESGFGCRTPRAPPA